MGILKILCPGLFHDSAKFTVLKIYFLISCFYVIFLTSLKIVFWSINEKAPNTKTVLSDTAYDAVSGSLFRCVACWASGIPLAFVTQYVVSKAEHCFDYLLCVFVVHLLVSWWWVRFPIDYNWYVTFGLLFSGTSLIAEFLSGGIGRKQVEEEE